MTSTHTQPVEDVNATKLSSTTPMMSSATHVTVTLIIISMMDTAPLVDKTVTTVTSTVALSVTSDLCMTTLKLSVSTSANRRGFGWCWLVPSNWPPRQTPRQTRHHFPGVSDQRASYLCPVLRHLKGGEQPVQVELLQLLLLQGEQLLQLHHRGHRPHRLCFWKQRLWQLFSSRQQWPFQLRVWHWLLPRQQQCFQVRQQQQQQPGS